jgi:hypothetical protein
VIAETVERLPPEQKTERGTEVEQTLVELARSKDPRTLSQLANGSLRI